MPDKAVLEKLIDRAPLAIVIIGVLVFIIGAAGGLPVGNPPLQVVDFVWRIGLGAMGLILTTAGLLLLVREGKIINSDPPVEHYGIKIVSPKSGAQLNGDRHDFSGIYKVKPRDKFVVFFEIHTDNYHYWPKSSPVTFD